MTHDASRNKMDELEAVIHEATEATGSDPYLAIAVAELTTAGWTVRPPLYHGGRWTLITPDGTRTSWSALRVMSRLSQLLGATCAECGAEIIKNRPSNEVRGPRVDRRYCSNACRQRAYRKRQQEGEIEDAS